MAKLIANLPTKKIWVRKEYLTDFQSGFGEFVENNRDLLPSSYVVEWWILDGEKEGIDMQSLLDAGDIKFENPTSTQVVKWSKELKIPLHQHPKPPLLQTRKSVFLGY